MLDLQRESSIPLKAVPKHLPRRNGKKVHYSTVYRWATKGVRGKVLESALVGGVRYTSLEALARFMESDSHGRNWKELADINAALNEAGV